jgi:serine/threonine protein kinase
MKQEGFNEVCLLLRLCDMDLKKLLKSNKHLEEVQIKAMVYDILCACKFMHEAKIIHRDLKPANILVNDDCTIQVCDFGLARSMDGIYHEQCKYRSSRVIEPEDSKELPTMPQYSTNKIDTPED